MSTRPRLVDLEGIHRLRVGGLNPSPVLPLGVLGIGVVRLARLGPRMRELSRVRSGHRLSIPDRRESFWLLRRKVAVRWLRQNPEGRSPVREESQWEDHWTKATNQRHQPRVRGGRLWKRLK